MTKDQRLKTIQTLTTRAYLKLSPVELVALSHELFLLVHHIAEGLELEAELSEDLSRFLRLEFNLNHPIFDIAVCLSNDVY